MAEITKISTASLCSPLPPPSGQTSGLKAGEALGNWDTCYVDLLDGKVYRATGAAADKKARVRGWTPQPRAIGDPVTLFHGNVNVNYGTGLTPGADYYLSGTVPGGLADAASTGGLKAIAFAIDATRIRLLSIF